MTIISSVLIADRRLIGVMNMTLEEKINRLREATEKYRKNTNAEPQNSFEAEAKKVAEHEAEKNKQLADWLEELKRYKDLEEQGRLLVLPCKVGDTVYENNGGRCQSDKWISVDDAMPAEKNSIFAKLKGTDKWNSIMWEKTSDEVIVCIEFEDGTRKTTVAKTHDGIWKLDTKILKMKVTHWMPLPELPKEVLE